MKGQTICQLCAFINLKKEGIIPERDIIFLATCDEEVGGKNGVEYMLNEVPSLRDASFVISEGGFFTEDEGVLNAQISVAEKKLAQFYIKASGTGGHGSAPGKDIAGRDREKPEQARRRQIEKTASRHYFLPLKLNDRFKRQSRCYSGRKTSK